MAAWDDIDVTVGSTDEVVDMPESSPADGHEFSAIGIFVIGSKPLRVNRFGGDTSDGSTYVPVGGSIVLAYVESLHMHGVGGSTDVNLTGLSKKDLARVNGLQ